MIDISPLAPKEIVEAPEISGIKCTCFESGIKYKGRNDLLLAEFPEDTIVAGVFTKSTTASANILWAREVINYSKAKILVVNSGNANVFNGSAGETAVSEIVKFCSEKWKCKKEEVYFFSTGIIGEILDYQKILKSFVTAGDDFKAFNWLEAAKAISTTDTYPKVSCKEINISGNQVKITGIAKGSGMIAPDMATMLAYIFTDVSIDPLVLKNIFSEIADDSFNSITVDSDTSTSDAALVFSTCKAGNEKISSEASEGFYEFKEALKEVCLDLAHHIVKDGEGASKFIEIRVSGAENDLSAKKIAFSIGNSPLVKTAIAGEDPNWGRIIMAIGKSKEKIDINKIFLSIGDLEIIKDSALCNISGSDLTNYMKKDHIEMHIDVGVSKGKSTVWTCDFTSKYISINADYTS